MSRQPIALFDSGVGGLSVLQALEKLLPNEDFIYFSDSANFPYGDKSAAELIRTTSQITAFLLTLNIQMLVIPCHTASAIALPALKPAFPIPMIGMIAPTIEMLKQTTHKQRIALLGTERTIQSGIYQRELPSCSIFPLTCSKLVEKIQRGENDIQELIQDCIKPILGKQIDALLLACTHFPLVKKEIEEALDPETIVLDPATAVAEEVKRLIQHEHTPETAPHHIFYSSGDIEILKKYLKKHPMRSPFEVQKVNFSIRAD